MKVYQRSIGMTSGETHSWLTEACPELNILFSLLPNMAFNTDMLPLVDRNIHVATIN
jgi:hypothetical protein